MKITFLCMYFETRNLEKIYIYFGKPIEIICNIYWFLGFCTLGTIIGFLFTPEQTTCHTPRLSMCNNRQTSFFWSSIRMSSLPFPSQHSLSSLLLFLLPLWLPAMPGIPCSTRYCLHIASSIASSSLSISCLHFSVGVVQSQGPQHLQIEGYDQNFFSQKFFFWKFWPKNCEFLNLRRPGWTPTGSRLLRQRTRAAPRIRFGAQIYISLVRHKFYWSLLEFPGVKVRAGSSDIPIFEKLELILWTWKIKW